MNSQNVQFQSIKKSSYTFKRAELPLAHKLDSSFNSIIQKKQEQCKDGPVKWIDVARIYCKKILHLYPYQQYKSEYDQQIFLIESEINFRNSTQPGIKWILLKSNNEINEFTKRWDKTRLKAKFHQIQKKIKDKLFHQHKQDKKQQPNQSKLDNVFKILGNLENFQSEKQRKNHMIFEKFLERILPVDKINLRVLGQYQVRCIQVGGFINCIKNALCIQCISSPKYIVTLTNQNILFSEDTLIDGQIEEAVPFTYALTVEYDVPELNKSFRKFAASITSGKTHKIIVFQNLFDLLKFAFNFNQIKLTTPYFQNLRYKSFSPNRLNNWVRFYNDGEQYFSDLHDQIELAEKKICITGWCITPYFLLKRPSNIETGPSRFDRTLERAAKRGVKIFVLIFQEPSLFINTDSFNVWNSLQNLHKNIKVLRHPGIIIPQLWSHHQKSVIIDQKIGFMGGLDVCYGRWDCQDHPIHDVDGLWDGADYNNERLRSITEPRKYLQSNLNRGNEPRMPWHDIALQIRGSAVIDLQRHFVQYWYFVIADLSGDPDNYLKQFKKRYREIVRQKKQKQSEGHISLAEDKQQQSLTNLFTAKPPPEQSQMESINLAYADNKIKSSASDFSLSDRLKSAKQAFKDIVKHKSSPAKQILVQGFMTNAKPGNLNLQLCRSSCKWSTGIKNVQHSIYNAYLHLISQAKQFIYIENQFFMSQQNQISEKIAQKIRYAFRNKTKFKVIVMMPLLPGFQGDVTNENSGVLRIQMQIQYEAISRHPSSIYQLLQDLPMNVKDYIYFVGLRNHGLFGQNKDIPKTELIYVHSKLMIVDDRFMIIGSANLNDRSLLGSRDSELAVVIQDSNGSIGKGQIFDFRCRLFKEHFDMEPSNCIEIHSYWQQFIELAINNSLIYRRVFGCYPDNTAHHYEDVKRLKQEAKIEDYWKQVIHLHGHYVEWPVSFLKKQDLRLHFGQLQFLAPITSFT